MRLLVITRSIQSNNLDTILDGNTASGRICIFCTAKDGKCLKRF